MAANGLAAFDTTLQHTHEWLDDLMDELGTDSRPQAWYTLTVVLHAVRDRLPPDEAAHLAAQLPMLVRGMFYDGWRPSATPVKRAEHDFGFELESRFPEEWREGADRCAMAVFRVLSRHVSEGEIRDVLNVLPREVRALWERSAAA